MNLIKLKSDRKRDEFWGDLDNMSRLYKSNDLIKETFDIGFAFSGGGYLEEYETQEERDKRFEEVFAKWSGKPYLKSVE